MAKVDFKRVSTNAEIDNIEIKDGQFIVTGEGGSYVDFGNERTPITSTPQIYSSTEKVIGKWIDGKTLYQKTISYTPSEDINTDNTHITHNIAHGIENVDFIFLDKAFRIQNVSSHTLPLPIIFNTTYGDAFLDVYEVSPTNISLFLQNVVFWHNTTLVCVLNYTKTTD